jgi:hypothetical protein
MLMCIICSENNIGCKEMLCVYCEFKYSAKKTQELHEDILKRERYSKKMQNRKLRSEGEIVEAAPEDSDDEEFEIKIQKRKGEKPKIDYYSYFKNLYNVK